MTAPVFVDTNVLLYGIDTSCRDKQHVAVSWTKALWENRTGRVSAQVLNEFFTNATRKLASPLSDDEAWLLAESYFAWKPVPLDNSLQAQAWQYYREQSLSWWDALIVAAAVRAECRFLLTEDLQHEYKLTDELTVINPFKVSPTDLA